MRKLFISAAFLSATTLLACSFQAGTGSRTPRQGAATPQGGQGGAAPSPAPQTTSTAPTMSGPPIAAIGRPRRTGTADAGAPSTTEPAPTAPGTTPTTPPGIPTLQGQNAFGSGTGDATSFKGMVFWIPEGSAKLPPVESRTPAGVLYASKLDVSSRAFTEGFPGIDAQRTENFAIRYEAPLVVENAGDYELRVVSDDGAKVLIGGTVIVDNDSAHDPKGKTGPVHLVQGTHLLTVDYFQSKGKVALQLYCKKAGGTEQICPTRL
jgi:hypothetical protein